MKDGILGIMRDGELVDEFYLADLVPLDKASRFYGSEYTVDIDGLTIQGVAGHEWSAYIVQELGISYDERPGTNRLVEIY